MRFFCRISFALLLASVMCFLIPSYNYILVLSSTLWVMCVPTGGILFQGLMRYFLLFLIGFLFTFLLSKPWMSFQCAITLGAVIGISCNLFLFKEPLDKIFRQKMITQLDAYKKYFHSIIQLFLQQRVDVKKEKRAVEQALMALPFWVYSRGIDARFKSGHSYFINKMGELAEVLFAMHHLARHSFPENLREIMAHPLGSVQSAFDSYFSQLIQVIALQALTEEISACDVPIDQLERHFKEAIPLSSELIDLSKDYVYLAELIYRLKDFNEILIKLGLTLR